MVYELVRQIPHFANTDSPHSLKLTKHLLQELVFVAGNCTTFTRRQIRQFVIATEGPLQVKYRYPRLSKYLPFDVLDIIPGASESLLEYYAICIRIAAQGVPPSPVSAGNSLWQYPFAGFAIDYQGMDKTTLSLKDIAQRERETLEQFLGKLIWHARTNPGSVPMPDFASDPFPYAGN